VLGWAIFGSGGEEALDASVQFCQQWQGAGSGRITTLLAPHAPYTCPDDFLRMVAAASHETDLNIHIHAAETMDQTRASLERTGRTPIQILEDTGLLDRPTIVAHACGATDDDIAILAKHGASVAHCPKTYLKLGMDVARVTDMQAAGIHVGLGTDGAVSNNTMSILEAMRLLALTQKHQAQTAEVMTVAEALYTATRGGAYALGMGDELGALEPGFLADIALLDMSGLHHQPLHNPAASLVYNAETHDVHTVIIDGQIVMRRKRVLTIDVTDVLEQARRATSRLSVRDPAQRIQTYAP
jgi:5-methylthioadenosine/S-adenosylhomocysteine deaminase